MILGIIIDGIEGAIDLFLSNAFLAKLGRDNALRDLLMLVARFCPGKSELLIIDKTSLLKSIDSCLCNLIFNSAGFEVSEQLPLTLRTCNERIERNCICSFVRVGAALYLLIEK